MKKLIVISLLLFTLKSALAQTDFTLYNMPALSQVSLTNPASIPMNRFNLGLPVISGIYLTAGSTGFTLGDVIDGSQVDLQGLSNALENSNRQVNNFNSNIRLDLFTLGFRAGNNYIHLHAREIISTSFLYNNDMLNFLIEGNGASFFGRRADFDGLGFNFSHYREYGASYARRVNSKLTVGARYKYLYGMENITTENSQFGITTTENYDIILDGAFRVSTAGLDSNSINQVTNGDYMGYALGRNNTGFGLDFGAKFKLNEQITLSASVLDIGYITWRESVVNYSQSELNFTFSGIDLGDIFAPDTAAVSSGAFDVLADSLISQIDIVQTNETYRSGLNSRIFAAASYNVTSRFQLTAVSFSQFLGGRLYPSFSFGANTSIGNFLTLSANYSAFGGSLGNIGTGFTLNFSALQLYALTDNILAPLYYDQRKNFHIRFGINIAMGRDYESH